MNSFSTAASDLEAKVMDFFTLCDLLWDSTAPTPYGDASHDKMSGRELSKYTKSDVDFKAVFIFSSCFCVHNHFLFYYFLFNNWYNGAI